MKKQATRQRIERAVEKVYADQNHTAFSPYEVTELIMAERQRIRRAVRKLKRAHMNQSYMNALKDILNRLRG